VGEVAREVDLSDTERDLVPVPEGIPVGGDLLRILSFDRQKSRKKAVPLMMEFGVNPDTGPFLVSSTRSVMWIAPRVPRVRAAFRHLQVGTFFTEVIDAVAAMGAESRWGNVQPPTPDGLLAAIGHLRSYDLPAPEVLAHPDFSWDGPLPVTSETDGESHRTLLGLPLELADWLDPATLVVVPQERDYVGFVMTHEERGLGLVHNACRGIAVCRKIG
jgi:hypothetical protein